MDDEWVEYVDEVTGVPYLYNNATGESQWIEPTLPISTSKDLDEWETHYDEDGNEFYFNNVLVWYKNNSLIK